MSLLLRKLYLYFTKDPDESIIFQGGGGVQLFPGDKCLFRLGPIFVLAIFQGGVSGPPILLWIRTWAMSS